LQLGVNHLEDWYKVSQKQLKKSRVKKYGGISSLLNKAYPQHLWISNNFLQSRVKKRVQQKLKRVVSQIFPNAEIVEEYTKPHFVFSNNEKMFFDLFLPSLGLAIEYHGEQHFQDIEFFKPQLYTSKRDLEKKNKCEEFGITILEIPYWWDLSKEGIIHAIEKQHPRLISK